MNRMMFFLVLALAVGFALLFSRGMGHAKFLGTPGHFQGRGDNAEAWKPYQDRQDPNVRNTLKRLCEGRCPDTTFLHTLLPDDNLLQFLNSYRAPETGYKMDPLRRLESENWMEVGPTMEGALSPRSTIADFQKALHDSLGPELTRRRMACDDPNSGLRCLNN